MRKPHRDALYCVKNFPFSGKPDPAELVPGEIHQPDFIERAGIGEFVESFVFVDQMGVCINALHGVARQMLNFGAVAVARSVAIVQFG